MTAQRLRTHHESKCTHQSADGAGSVTFTPYPANRLEACLLDCGCIPGFYEMPNLGAQEVCR
jgi:hypothetical protein